MKNIKSYFNRISATAVLATGLVAGAAGYGVAQYGAPLFQDSFKEVNQNTMQVFKANGFEVTGHGEIKLTERHLRQVYVGKYDVVKDGTAYNAEVQCQVNGKDCNISKLDKSYIDSFLLQIQKEPKSDPAPKV